MQAILLGLFPNRSIVFKLIMAALVMNLIGLGASFLAVTHLGERNLYALAEDEWMMQTRQIARASAGSIRWNKPEVFDGLMATYRDDDRQILSQAWAFDASGRVVAEYVREGADGEAIAEAANRLRAKAGETARTEIVDGHFVIVSPAGKRKDGTPIGHVAMAWNLRSIDGILGNLNLGSGMAQGVSTLLLVLLLFVTASMLIGRPLRAITRRIELLAAGDHDSPVPHAGRGDEVGIIARSIDGFRTTSREKIEAERRIHAQTSQIEAERHANEASRAQAAEALTKVVDGLAAALTKLADGDVTARIETDFPGEYRKLRQDFNSAMERLGDAMRTIIANGSQIEAGTQEIRRAADDLARRAEQQAAAVEQTAAAIGQISSAVGVSTERAQQTEQLVDRARADAEISGKVVGQAIEAMERIARSSEDISRIIGVIDDIAFQTNLLALNAGVEAARAGDAGRGFAVVAQEVRELAQRSAQAAKEIKQLIATSGQQVKSGVDKVSETGAVLDKIVGSVRAISANMSSIVESAHEQAGGLKEIDHAVASIDQSTQHNAALAEELTASSHSLSREVEATNTLLARFRTGRSDTAAASTTHKRDGASPARELNRRVAAAFSGNNALAESNWEEF